MVTDFISENGEWNYDLLKATTIEDANIIRNLPINIKLNDRWIRHHDRHRSYSVKYGSKWYQRSQLYECSSSNNNMEKIGKSLWKLKIPLKIKHSIWSILKNIIPYR